MALSNKFAVITVDGYDFASTPDVSFGFHSTGLALLNRGNFTVEYSFDGEEVHGDLNPNDASAGLTFDNRYESKIFFRAVDGYSTVRVEAWRGLI